MTANRVPPPFTPADIIAVCARLGPGISISTADLLAKLGTTAADDYSALQTLVRHGDVNAVHTVGLPTTRRGRTIRPLLWHAPKMVCHHCGGSGFQSNVSQAAPAELAQIEEW